MVYRLPVFAIRVLQYVVSRYTIVSVLVERSTCL